MEKKWQHPKCLQSKQTKTRNKMLGTQAYDTNLFNYSYRRGLDFPLDILEANRGQFTDAFCEWLPTNLHIFSEFCARAKAIRKRGRKHYGAKTIVEVIRFETDLRSSPDESFKCNNNYTAYLARLCMMAYTETDGLFETREAKKVYENERGNTI